MRSVLGIVTDWTESASSVWILRDTIFALLFGILLILVIRGSDKEWIKVVFGFVFSLLIIFHFIQTRSLEGMGKFTALGSIILLVVIYKNHWMWIMPILFFIPVSILTLNPSAFDWLNIPVTAISRDYRGDISFWISCIGISVIVFYIKYNYDIRQENILKVTDELNKSNKLLISQNEELELNRIELEKANQKLNQRIENRTKELSERNKAVKTYIELNTKEILPPLKETINEINTLNEFEETLSEDDKELFKLLRASGHELDTIYEQIKKTLIKDGKITRNDFS